MDAEDRGHTHQRKKIEMLDVMNSEFYKKKITLETLSQFQLVCENFAYLCQPGDFDLHCGGLEETNTHMGWLCAQEDKDMMNSKSST